MQEKRMVDFEIRADAADQTGKLVGRAAVFNSETVIGGMFREVIRPGAFKKSLEERNIKMLWNHDPSYPMGSTRGGTLKLRESEDGLEVENDPPTAAPYAGFRQNIERGDVSQMSFGFEVVKEQRTEANDKEPLPLREILEVKLFEVSPVAFPAYDDTEIEARARQLVEAWTEESARIVRVITDEANESRTTEEPDASAVHSAAGRMSIAEVEKHREYIAAEQELV